MKPKLLLRIASVIMFIHAVGHTFGHSGWKTPHHSGQKEIIRQMTDHKFPFMGSTRSFGEYYEGYGYACTLALLLISIVLWIVSQSNIYITRQLILVTALILVFWGIIELRYFFLAAASFTIISAGLSFVAFYYLIKETKN